MRNIVFSVLFTLINIVLCLMSISCSNHISDQSLVFAPSSLDLHSHINTSGVSGGILVTAQAPIINVSGSANPSGSLLITNVGEASVTISTISVTAGINNLSGCYSGEILGAGSSCTISFNLSTGNGSGLITVYYTSVGTATSISQTVTWYNSTNGALLNMSYSNPVDFEQSTTQNITVTVTNIGGYNLNNLTIPATQVLVGDATVNISYPSSNSCQNATLNIGASCQFILSVSSGVSIINQQILFGITGTYNNGSTQTYLRYAIMNGTVVSGSYLYVANGNSYNFGSYSINQSSGALNNLATYAVSSYTYTIIIAPNGAFMYVSCYANGSSTNLYGYFIDANTGGLTAMSGSPFNSGGVEPYALAITPNGKFFYAGNLQTGNIGAFTINQTTGLLTAVSGSPFSSPTGAQQIIIDATGSYLYLLNSNSQILEYSINQTTGGLTQIGTATVSTFAFSFVISPNNKFIYIPSSVVQNSVSAFSIGSDGTLSLIGTYILPGEPMNISISPNDNFLYVTNLNTNNISAYTINQTTGALTQVSGSPFAAAESATAPYLMQITSDSNFLYVSSGGDYPAYAPSALSAFSINPTTGALTKISEYSIGPGGASSFQLTNNFLYATSDLNNCVYAYIINPTNGTLTYVSGQPFATGLYPRGSALL